VPLLPPPFSISQNPAKDHALAALPPVPCFEITMTPKLIFLFVKNFRM
jgi:hypothetical protein